jgi:putative PEP-CTERM system TPR-repeat lipoprotein
LQQILRAAPDYAPALLLLGAVESATGANQLAEQHVRSFLDLYPGHLHATKLMAALQVRANNHAAALELLAPALKQYPADADLLTLAGEAHMRARNFDRAAGYFEQASALQPRAANLHTAVALGRLGSGDYQRALAELESAARLDIQSPRTGTLLVMSYLRANAPAKALAAVQAMEKQGDSALVQNLKGGVLLARHDLAGARASFSRALALDPLHLPALDNLAQLDVLERRPADARQRYLAALARSPRSTPLMEALSRLAAGQGQPAEAIAWLERACKENPASLTLALRLIEQTARGGDTARALLLSRKLQASNPSSPQALSMVVEMYALRKELPAAAEACAKLAALQPTAARPQMRLAALKLALHEPAAAAAALKKAIALAPDSLEPHQMLLDLLAGQGKFDEAARLAVALQQRSPQAGAGFKLEGDLLTAQRKPAAALAAYEQAFAREPGGALVIQLHGALTALGRTSEADGRMARWLEPHPDDVAVRLHDASSKLVRNDFRGAIGQLDAVLQREPHNVLALNDLAWAMHRVGDKGALAYAERALKLAPRNPAVMDTLGSILLDSGELKRSLALLQQASALAPDASEIRFHFGLVLAKTGDKRGARRELERLLAAPGEFARRAEATALLATL